MAEVKIYSQLIRGSEHVHSNTRNDGEEPCILFVPHMEVNGHRIRTETPEGKKWTEKAKAGMVLGERAPEGAWPQPELSVGEGFLVLNIKHADDETWSYLSTLPAEEYGEGSMRESFDVLVTHLEYIQLEPGDGAPWHGPSGPKPSKLADLERSAA